MIPLLPCIYLHLRYFISLDSNNAKLLAAIENRQRTDHINFQEAGKRPIIKTYSYDPTKVKKKDVVSAKGK